MSQADDAIAYARDQIGKPYVFGADGPDAFDCSGLIVAAYKAADPPIRLPHWTGALIFEGDEISRSNLQPGDLVFPDAGHVQLYVGNNQIIEAPQPGTKVRMGPMWGFWRARRVTNKPGQPLSSAAAGVVDALNPFDEPMEAIAAALRPYAVAGTNIVNPKFWQRVAMYSVGLAIVGIGIVWLFRRPIANTAGTVSSTAGQLAQFVVGGAAIGGAEQLVRNRMNRGASSAAISGTVVSGPTTAVTRFPRAPNPANRGVARAEAPVTAPTPTSPYVAPRSPGGTYRVFRGTAPRPTTKPPSRDAPDTGPFFIGGKRGKR